MPIPSTQLSLLAALQASLTPDVERLTAWQTFAVGWPNVFGLRGESMQSLGNLRNTWFDLRIPKD